MRFIPAALATTIVVGFFADYVESGHGLVPIHCASFCFLNSPKYIALIGGQF